MNRKKKKKKIVCCCKVYLFIGCVPFRHRTWSVCRFLSEAGNQNLQYTFSYKFAVISLNGRHKTWNSQKIPFDPIWSVICSHRDAFSLRCQRSIPRAPVEIVLIFLLSRCHDGLCWTCFTCVWPWKAASVLCVSVLICRCASQWRAAEERMSPRPPLRQEVHVFLTLKVLKFGYR